MGARGLGALANGQSRKDFGFLAAHDADASGVFQLTGGLLEAEVESFLLELAEANLKFVSGKFAGLCFGFLGGHGIDGLNLGNPDESGVRIAGDEAGADAELVGGEAHGFAGCRFRDATDFEKHVARADHSDPTFDRAFTFTHPGFRRAGGDGLVWEDADPDLTLTLKGAVDRDTAGFDLAVGHPSAVESLKAEVTEGNSGSALGISRSASAVALAELGSFWHQRHGSVLLFKRLGKIGRNVRSRESVAILWGTAIASAISTAAAVAATVTTTTAVIAAVTLRLLAVVFLLVDPALDTNDAVEGAGFGETVVERNAERLERHLAFAISFGTGDVRTTEAAGAAEADAFRAEFHGGLKSTLHGAAEADPALKLDGDLLGNQLGVELRLADFDDVDFHLGTFADTGDVAGHDLDFLALATDDQTRAGSVESDADAVPSALDDNTGQASVLQLVFQISADREIFVEFICVVFATGIPLGAPVFVDGEAECDRIYFLAHGR